MRLFSEVAGDTTRSLVKEAAAAAVAGTVALGVGSWLGVKLVEWTSDKGGSGSSSKKKKKKP